ncbi:MAG: acyl-CoA desaturase, partial [Marmoricola sp.]
MAIADVKEYTHLSPEEVEEFGRELDAIRADIEESRGADDAAYINRMITIQRRLLVAGRLTLFASKYKPAFFAGAAMVGVAKILENMEIGHNVMHGQWDWMNDPEIHSSTWDWDTAQPAEQWKHSHNYVHHQFTNVLGFDNDIGYGILRMAREQRWHPHNLGQPVYNAMLAALFQWGVALHDLDLEAIRKGEKDPKLMKKQLRQIGRKVSRQFAKDYILFPALAGPAFVQTAKANALANLSRNLWSYMIIFCGHFPDGALHFTEEEVED